MENMKTKCLLLICFVITMIACGGSPHDDIMPDGFEGIHIGMDWRSVVLSRPNAEFMMAEPGANRKPDPAKPGEGFFEKLKAASFNLVAYLFKDGVLVAVTFAKEHNNSTVGKSDELIRKVARTRGPPNRIDMLVDKNNLGVLIWQDQALHINVIVPLDDTAPAEDVRLKPTIGFQIMKRTFAEQIKAVGTAGNSRTGKALQAEDTKHLEAFKSRIQKLLSASEN